MPKPPRSLKVRALQWLAQREQSRAELRRRLLPFAVAEERAELETASEAEPGLESEPRWGSKPKQVPRSRTKLESESESESGPALAMDTLSGLPAADRVEAVLDWLEAHRFQSQTRFVESRVHARMARFGNLRIRHELRQHELGLSDDAARALSETELQRARAVRDRKFGDAVAGDAASKARQARFLAGRGFSADVIGRVVRAPSSRSEALADDDPRDSLTGHPFEQR